MKLGIEPTANGSATVYVGIFSEDLNTKTRRRIEVKTEAFMTEKEIMEEYKDPTFDLVARTRERRLDWAKDLLQADSELPSRQIMIASVQA